MKDGLLVIYEYQGLNLHPCHKRETCTKYVKQVFSDVHNNVLL